jgi:hypothetical protein
MGRIRFGDILCRSGSYGMPVHAHADSRSVFAAALRGTCEHYQPTIDQLFRMGKVAGLHVQRAERRHHNQISFTPLPLNVVD